MRFAVVALAAALAACSYEVTTPDFAVNARPSPEVVLGADPAGFTVTQGDAALSELAAELHRTLVSDSGGAVRSAGGQPLNLSAALRFDGEDTQGSVFIGVFSLFIPPLAFVPESPEKRFTVSYVLRDRQNQVVRERSLDGKVEGSFKGFYIARINANSDLLALEKKTAVKNAARMILQDVYANSSEIAGALRRLRAETASESAAEPKPAAQDGGQWWQQ